MSRFLISVALLVGLSFAVSSAAPLQTYAQVAAEGPRCASPTNPDKTMNCAVMLQMADMLLQTYADGMKEYGARLQAAEEAENQEKTLEEVEAKLLQINNPNSTCIKYKIISQNPFKQICIEWSSG